MSKSICKKRVVHCSAIESANVSKDIKSSVKKRILNIARMRAQRDNKINACTSKKMKAEDKSNNQSNEEYSQSTGLEEE